MSRSKAPRAQFTHIGPDTTLVDASVIVPAYKENANITFLVTEIFRALESHSDLTVEVIIVDDNSQDGTSETVEYLKMERYNVKAIVRKTERGLSSAIIRGFKEARGERLICMDADLQVKMLSEPLQLNLLVVDPKIP
jgi:dolichol-phosphate mannosyltransferase